MYPLKALNMINCFEPYTEIELVAPDICGRKIEQKDFKLVNPKTAEVYRWVCDGHECMLYTNMQIQEGSLIRAKDPDFIEGQIRDTGR